MKRRPHKVVRGEDLIIILLAGVGIGLWLTYLL